MRDVEKLVESLPRNLCVNQSIVVFRVIKLDQCVASAEVEPKIRVIGECLIFITGSNFE